MSPIFLAAVTTLVPLIPGIVHGVEQLFGPKTGETKMGTAVSMLQQLSQALATAGKLPGIPDIKELQALIETVVQALKAQGQLGGNAAQSAPNVIPMPMAAGSYNVVITMAQEKKAA